MAREANIIVHGGAWDIPDELVEGHIKGTKRAVEIGMDILRNGGEAAEAVVEAVASMEDDEVFDAGRGAFLNRDGEVELDAIFYDGNHRAFGSIMAARLIKNPIRAARHLAYEKNMSILACDGADIYARDIGLETVDNSYFIVERERRRWQEYRKTGVDMLRAFKGGTVGAVACDSHGGIAAAVSTGGTPYKHVGRVGDTPVPGAGAYATPEAACAATGIGEGIMKVMLTRTVVELYRNGEDPWEACRRGVEMLKEDTGLVGGVILVTADGRTAFAYNTSRMARAYLSDGGIVGEV